MDVDRVLKKTMGAGGDGPPTEACLDAETLAAWSDGTLSRRERDAAEAHAADCDRCLSVLATLTRTLPPTPAASWTRWLSPRWIVPLTAATAAAVWIAVQPGIRQRSPATTAQQFSEPTAAPSPPAAPPPPAAESRERRADSASASAAKRQLPPQGKAAGVVPDAEVRKEALDSISASASASANRSQEEKRADTKLERQPAEKDVAESVAVQSRANAAPSTARTAAAAAASPPPAGPEPSRFAQAPERPIEIPSPDPQIRWRIRGAVVERSSSAGQGWQAQSPGTATRLIAGSSPSPTVCWIAGANGTVLLTTDGGETWLTLPSPEPSDLIAITAGSGSQALVTAASGRVYRTLDGGRTWTLQEPPSASF